MPVSTSSRYAAVTVYNAVDAEGVSHPTIAIRPFTPPPADASFYRYILAGVEDIEYLAWQFYGSSDAWWRIAEANERTFPLDLAPGMTINIPGPGEVGRIVRTRRF